MAEAKQFHGFIGDTASLQIVARDLARGLVGERGLPALRDLLVNLEQRFLKKAVLLLPRVFFKLQRQVRPFGQPPHGFGEGDVFVFLDEREHVAALVTAEAMKDLSMRIDVEARRFLFVKRAEGDEVCAGAFEREIRANDIDDVAGGADLFEG